MKITVKVFGQIKEKIVIAIIREAFGTKGVFDVIVTQRVVEGFPCPITVTHDPGVPVRRRKHRIVPVYN